MTLTPVDQFKTKTLQLISDLHLSDEVVVGLGIGMAVAHAVTGIIDPATLHKMIDDTFDRILDAAEEVQNARH